MLIVTLESLGILCGCIDMIDNKLCCIAGQAVIDAYDQNIDLGTTEYSSSVVEYNGFAMQVVAIPGTNEWSDWLKNINPLSENGIKKASVEAAREIHSNVHRMRKVPLLVTGHSKGGATAIAYKKLFGADYCVAFCPARSLRYGWDNRMENTTLVISPSDPVPMLGFFSFCHPACDRIYLPFDFPGFKISSHSMKSINHYIEDYYCA